jgi:hypothetical protein
VLRCRRLSGTAGKVRSAWCWAAETCASPFERATRREPQVFDASNDCRIAANQSARQGEFNHASNRGAPVAAVIGAATTGMRRVRHAYRTPCLRRISPSCALGRAARGPGPPGTAALRRKVGNWQVGVSVHLVNGQASCAADCRLFCLESPDDTGARPAVVADAGYGEGADFGHPCAASHHAWHNPRRDPDTSGPIPRYGNPGTTRTPPWKR